MESTVTIVFCVKSSAASISNSDYSYYYNDGKIKLEPSQEIVAIYFSEQVTNEQKADLISRSPSLKEISRELLNGKLILASINQTNDVNIPEVVRTQNQLSQVNFCVPVFERKGHKSFMQDKFVVRFNEDVTEEYIEALNKKCNVEIISKSPYRHNRYALRILNPKDITAIEMANIYYENPNTKYATPSFLTLDVLHSVDEFFSGQWNLHNTGQSPPGGTADADIDAPEGWNIETGSSDIVIAIVDTGVDMDHPDLDGNIWINTGETPENSTDDDNNGYIDDVYGWDFVGDGVNPDNDPTDIEGHGTICAGLAAAETNNTIGVAGVAYGCKIMPLRVMLPGVGLDVDYAEQAIDYACNNGANVINCSWGDINQDDDLDDAISEAKEAGCVLIFASGNDTEDEVSYPGSLDDVIAVGATDKNDEYWDYSNYGTALDVVAPSGYAWRSNTILWTTDIAGPRGKNPGGSENYGDEDGDYFKYAEGTSGSAPQVAGLAALILSLDSSLTPDEVQELIECTADDVDDPGWDEHTGWGRINVYRALDETSRFNGDNLVGWWKFDEGSGTTAGDSTGTNDGAIDGASWTPNGMFDDALDFDGTDDYVLLSPVVAMVGNEVTISAWIKIETVSEQQYQPIVTQWYYDNGNYGYYLCLKYINSNVYPTFCINESEVVSNIAIQTGTWYNITGTYDGSSLRVYVNGYLNDEGEESVADEKGVVTTAYIGSDGGGSFEGLIDDVRTYNYALSPSEISNFSWPTVFDVRDSSNEKTAWIDEVGNLFLKGELTINPDVTSTPNDEFVVQTSTNVLAIIDTESGDMAIKTSYWADVPGTLSPSSGSDDFIIKNSSEDVVAYIDGDGYLYLKGSVFDN